jgi:hypothetical protein
MGMRRIRSNNKKDYIINLETFADANNHSVIKDFCLSAIDLMIAIWIG